MSYSKIILKVLESEPDRWFYSYELDKVGTPFGWIGTSGARRARELAESGEIEVRHINKYAEYKYKNEKDTTKVTSGDGERPLLQKVLYSGDNEREDRVASQPHLCG